MPRLLVDALGIDQPGGARTAVLEPLIRLPEQRPSWEFTVVLSAAEPALARFPTLRQVVVPVRKGLAARLVAQALFPLLAGYLRADLVHFTKAQASFVPAPYLLTIFDTTTLSRPELHSRMAVWYWRTLQPRMARRAQLVTTLSQHAAGEIVRTLGVPPERVIVIPCASRFLAPPPAAVAALRVRHDLPERYLLAVGILARWKNVGVLLEALRLLRAAGVAVPPLVLAGPRYPQSDGSAIVATIAQHGLADAVRYLGPVPDSELPALYAGSTLYLAPSLNEGFGITCLEAMACGAPVVAAAASATPEVVGSAGVLVDPPQLPQAWAEAIAALLADPARRVQLQVAGQERARAFRWEDAAARWVQLYEQVLSPGRVGVAG
ncbi:MAG: hypothetical protein KatS3mg061_0981 [Dehalococcoidia bacterium]|nr:MAG: hypothetical protein KatS3mg061_0981 [Dehalococcoidia bacterium]